MSEKLQSAESNSAPASERATALQKQLDRLREQLAAERASTSRATTLTAVVAVIALLLVCGYFAYGYKLFAEVTEPEKVVDAAEGMIEEKLPEARNTLEEQIIKSAPQWAAGLSKQAQDGLPDARKRLTDRFVAEAEKASNEASVLSEEHYRKFLRNNKSTLEEALKDLAKNPELAEATLQKIEIPLESELGGDMKLDAKELCRDIGSVRNNLQRLIEGKGLTPEQKVERRVWMLARRLQAEGMGQSTSESATTVPASTKPKGAAETPKKDLPKSIPDAPTRGPAKGKEKEPSK
jgi:hypothetical protein